MAEPKNTNKRTQPPGGGMMIPPSHTLGRLKGPSMDHGLRWIPIIATAESSHGVDATVLYRRTFLAALRHIVGITITTQHQQHICTKIQV